MDSRSVYGCLARGRRVHDEDVGQMGRSRTVATSLLSFVSSWRPAYLGPSLLLYGQDSNPNCFNSYELHRYIFDPNGEKGVFLLISVDVSLICLKEMERPRNVLKNVSQHFSVL